MSVEGKQYEGSLGKIALDTIVIILLGLILAKLWSLDMPESADPVIFPEEIKFIYDQPPVVVNIPETLKVTVDTGKVEVEQKVLPEIRTIIKETRTEEEVKDLLDIKEGDVNPLDENVKDFKEVKTEDEAKPTDKKKKKFEVKKLLPWNWFRKKSKE
jgi:hypothetical protein